MLELVDCTDKPHLCETLFWLQTGQDKCPLYDGVDCDATGIACQSDGTVACL